MLIEKIAAAAIPAVIALCGVLMLVSKKAAVRRVRRRREVRDADGVWSVPDALCIVLRGVNVSVERTRRADRRNIIEARSSR